MRALCLYTADLFNKAKTDHQQELVIGLLTPICKAYCSEQGFNVSSSALQAHGGYGYCTEYGVEQFVRDTQIAMIYEGTNGIQAIDFVMRKILKDGGKTLNLISQEIVSAVQSLDEVKFKKEKELFSKVLVTTQSIAQKISEYAKNNQFNLILQNCTDFLTFSSQVIVAWRLLESAKLSDEKLEMSTAEERKFYQSKITDFKVYCAHYLTHNLSLAKTILEFSDDMTTLEI
jgi:hypothetical protein